MKTLNEPMLLLLTGTLLLVITAVHPHDYTTWWMETAPIFIAVPIFIATYKSYTLTPLVYRLLFVHASSSWSADITPMPKYRWATGWNTGSASCATTTTRSATSQGFVPALCSANCAAQFAATPGQIAVHIGGRQLTYAVLTTNHRLDGILRLRGCRPRQRPSLGFVNMFTALHGFEHSLHGECRIGIVSSECTVCRGSVCQPINL